MKRVVYSQVKNREKLARFADRLQKDSVPDKEKVMHANMECASLSVRLSAKADFLRKLYQLIVSFIYPELMTHYNIAQLDNLFPGTCLQRSSMALDLFSGIYTWNALTSIDEDISYNLEDEPGFPHLISAKAQTVLFQFILQSESEPDRIKAFELYRKIVTVTGNATIMGRDRLIQKTDYLLNSLHSSHVEAGVMVVRLLCIDSSHSQDLTCNFFGLPVQTAHLIKLQMHYFVI